MSCKNRQPSIIDNNNYLVSYLYVILFGLVEGTTVAQSTSCPITGDYSGVVPGTSGLCAKVASDCNNPDIMFYSVSSCENRTHVYEGMYC